MSWLAVRENRGRGFDEHNHKESRIPREQLVEAAQVRKTVRHYGLRFLCCDTLLRNQSMDWTTTPETHVTLAERRPRQPAPLRMTSVCGTELDCNRPHPGSRNASTPAAISLFRRILHISPCGSVIWLISPFPNPTTHTKSIF